MVFTVFISISLVIGSGTWHFPQFGQQGKTPPIEKLRALLVGSNLFMLTPDSSSKSNSVEQVLQIALDIIYLLSFSTLGRPANRLTLVFSLCFVMKAGAFIDRVVFFNATSADMRAAVALVEEPADNLRRGA